MKIASQIGKNTGLWFFDPTVPSSLLPPMDVFLPGEIL